MGAAGGGGRGAGGRLWYSKEDFTEEVALVLGFEGWSVVQP